MGTVFIFVASTIVFVLAVKLIGGFIRFMIYHFRTGSNITTAILASVAIGVWIIWGL
jgi:hypothetical protein